MKYVTSTEIRKRLNIKSPTTLWRWQQLNQKMFGAPFPAPVKVSVGSPSLWDEEQVQFWELQYFRNNQSLTT